MKSLVSFHTWRLKYYRRSPTAEEVYDCLHKYNCSCIEKEEEKIIKLNAKRSLNQKNI